MLHGRRPHQNKIINRAGNRRRNRGIRMLNHAMQWRYSLILGFTSMTLAACFSIPAWHFVRDNYQIFQRLAYDSHPTLVSHLEREQIWITLLLILGTLSTGALTAWTTLRVTTIWLSPLMSVENHMRRLIRGDWSEHEFRTRESDEMREFTGTYAYLYQTLRAQAETELKLLEKLKVDESKVESVQALREFVNLKRQQLGLGPNPTADLPSPQQQSATEKRHAS